MSHESKSCAIESHAGDAGGSRASREFDSVMPFRKLRNREERAQLSRSTDVVAVDCEVKGISI